MTSKFEISLRQWNRKDKILAAILVSAILIATAYTSIVLLDPYYGPCEYVYNSNGKCQDNRAWHMQQSISDDIHKVIRG
jgi:hypothetical protein